MRAEFWQNVSHWQSSQLFLHEQSVHGTCGKWPSNLLAETHMSYKILQQMGLCWNSRTSSILFIFGLGMLQWDRYTRISGCAGIIIRDPFEKCMFVVGSSHVKHVHGEDPHIVCPQAIASFSKVFHCQHLIHPICSQQRASTFSRIVYKIH